MLPSFSETRLLFWVDLQTVGSEEAPNWNKRFRLKLEPLICSCADWNMCLKLSEIYWPLGSFRFICRLNSSIVTRMGCVLGDFLDGKFAKWPHRNPFPVHGLNASRRDDQQSDVNWFCVSATFLVRVVGMFWLSNKLSDECRCSTLSAPRNTLALLTSLPSINQSINLFDCSRGRWIIDLSVCLQNLDDDRRADG